MAWYGRASEATSEVTRFFCSRTEDTDEKRDVKKK